MAMAGAAWGIYSLLGKGSKNPIEETARNFIIAFGLCALIWLPALALRGTNYSLEGVTYAVSSGAFASGIGYSIWYTVLPKLTRFTASLVQLLVPVITAVFGVLLLNEVFTLRLGLAFILVSLGVAVGTGLAKLPGK